MRRIKLEEELEGMLFVWNNKKNHLKVDVFDAKNGEIITKLEYNKIKKVDSLHTNQLFYRGFALEDAQLKLEQGVKDKNLEKGIKC